MSYTAWSVAQDEVPNATKWNYLGGNDAHFYSFLGDNVDWQTWTPTWTNLTIGNATQTATYTQLGNTVYCNIIITTGSTTSIGTQPRFTLPVDAHADYAGTLQYVVGTCHLVDTGTASYVGSVRIAAVAANEANLYIGNTTATYVSNDNITSTVPFTEAAGDQVLVQIIYEAA